LAALVLIPILWWAGRSAAVLTSAAGNGEMGESPHVAVADQSAALADAGAPSPYISDWSD
jgi:hypothetical protein